MLLCHLMSEVPCLFHSNVVDYMGVYAHRKSTKRERFLPCKKLHKFSINPEATGPKPPPVSKKSSTEEFRRVARRGMSRDPWGCKYSTLANQCHPNGIYLLYLALFSHPRKKNKLRHLVIKTSWSLCISLDVHWWKWCVTFCPLVVSILHTTRARAKHCSGHAYDSPQPFWRKSWEWEIS